MAARKKRSKSKRKSIPRSKVPPKLFGKAGVHSITSIPASADLDPVQIREGIEKGDLEIVRGFALSGVKLDRALDGSYLNPLAMAAQYGQEEALQILLEAGGDPSVGGKYAPIVRAAKNGQAGTLKILLEAGVDPNPIGKSGASLRNPLWEAIHAHDLDCVKLLVKAGATVLLPGHEEGSALWTAWWGQREPRATEQVKSIYRFLLRQVPTEAKERWKGLVSLLEGVDSGNLRKVKFAVKTGVNLDCLLGGPLRQAAAQGDVDIVRELLRGGAGERIEDAFGAAIGAGSLEVVKLFREEVPAFWSKPRDRSGWLFEACCGNSAEVVQYLIEQGADARKKDSQGETALTYAVQEGNRKIFEVLLDAGADPGVKFDGDEPLVVACARYGHQHIVDLLEPHADAKDVKKARKTKQDHWSI